jgi:hypothetical protein
MAWRIDEQLVRGEIDNRVRGRVTGRLWFLGRAEPVVLELEGNAWRDVAGHVLRFHNPEPVAGRAEALKGLAGVQRGVVGDITASRKVKVPECSMEEIMRLMDEGRPFPWHWGNSLYLEWHGERNGRVVIESAGYQIEISGEAAWRMSAAEERAQREANERATTTFLERLSQAVGEAKRERGEPEPEEPTPEEAAERAEWIEEMNAAAEEEALREIETEKWRKGEAGGFEDKRWHPLVERCNALTHRVLDETQARGWLSEEEGAEHPLREVANGVMIAGGKLAGALGTMGDADDWPPDPLCAGSTLTRLKKARGHLRDALAGLDAADGQDLAEAEWRREVRAETEEVLAEVLRLIAEVRAVLRLSQEGGDGE